LLSIDGSTFVVWSSHISRSCSVSLSGFIAKSIFRSISRSGSISRGCGIGGLAVCRVGSLSRVRNISDIASVSVIHLIVDSLGPSIRKSHRVGASSGIAISLLTSVELGTIVVIHSIVVGIDCRRIIGWLLVGRVG
jgi:hypothetical protein